MRYRQGLLACGLSISLSEAVADEGDGTTVQSTASEDLGTQSAESDFSETPGRTINDNWTEYDLDLLTFRWGIFALVDIGSAIQSDASRELLEVPQGYKIRDLRLSFGGKLATKRSITYTTGLMFDGPTNKWLVRETGIQVGIPELWGSVFVGRQKEGISLSRITVGYAVPTMERTPMGDATIPILADGIKWLGGLPSHRANWNFAYYYNELVGSPSHDWYDQTFVGRICVLPIRNDATGDLLHLGVAYHYGLYANGEASLEARPESSTAPFFLDTGTFPAHNDNLFGGEAYFRSGSWFGGVEYFADVLQAPEVGDPIFHGGNVLLTWIMTGEQRPYIDLGGKMGFVEPRRSAFSGGPGAWEAVLNFSYADFDDADITGGRFWRVTPQLTWYIDKMVTVKAAYGLGSLDRFGDSQLTHFFQARFQFQIQ
jgi:phosphate-selective porin OprO and OprP